MAEEKAPWYKQSHLIRLNLSLIFLCFYGKYMHRSPPMLLHDVSFTSNWNHRKAASIGYDGSMMNSLQALPNWMDFMDNPESVWLGFINAVYWIAFLVTCPIAAWASNTFGRKRTIYFAYIPHIIGFVLQSTAKSPTSFIIGRVFLGIPSAIWANVAPLLIAECAYPPHRSKLTSLYFCGFHVGAAISAWCAFGTRSYGTSWTWRTVSICQCLCPVLALPGIFLCSESPRWLFITGQEEKARQILADTHANGHISSPEIQAEILEIETTLRQEQMSLASEGYRGLISTPGNRHRLLITVTLGIFSQWVGNGVVTYYLSMVLNTIGITSVKDQTLISGCLQIWNIIFSITGANLVDRLGRRVLFLLSFALMLTSYVIITACSGSFADSGVKAVGTTVIPFLFIFYAGYDIAM